MKILAIDSSGLTASIAIIEEGNLIAEYSIHYKKTHSQTLLPMLDEIKKMIDLELNQIEAIAVASGPGSFTGLRIGSATAKGLALGLKLPIIEVPTLEGLAYNMLGTQGLLCPIMDARRNQVYTGGYEFIVEDHQYKMETRIEACACGIEECIATINELGRPVTFLGDGVPVFREMILEQVEVPVCFAPAHMLRQKAGSIAALALEYAKQGKLVKSNDHAPDYYRMSQAERERMERE